MCDHREEYIYTPSVTIGGPTGDYIVNCPISSCQWAEYSVVSIVYGHTGSVCSVVVSGDSAPQQLVYDGSKTLSDNAVVQGMAFQLSSSLAMIVTKTEYERITHSQKRVFVRIDLDAGVSAYVSIRFRVKTLTLVPGPSKTVHPDHAQQMNIVRAEKTQERLKQMGIPGYANEGDK